MPRRLSPDEAGLWALVAASIRSLPGRITPVLPVPTRPIADRPPEPRPVPRRSTAANALAVDAATLDGSWERQIRTGRIVLDMTIDLHGYTRDHAHTRLTRLIVGAAGSGARVLLVITGKSRRDDGHGERTRGVIGASLRDWLHGPELRPYIAALRPAHPRHGGGGAWYVILRR